MNTELKKKLQAEIIWAATRSGAFQRSGIYSSKATDEQKSYFRNDTKQFLFKNIFLKYYGSQITEVQLRSLIDTFINRNKGNTALKRKELRYGNAQKFINLYLKSMWILGYIKTPPHFPVDRIILKQLKVKANWTDMNKMQYGEIISQAKDKIKQTNYKSIAEWEATEYQNIYLDIQ